MKLLFLIFFLSIQIFCSSVTRVELTGLVEQINKVKKSLSVESSQWLLEKKRLELELHLLKDALNSGKQSSIALQAKLVVLRQKIDLLKKQSASVKKELMIFDKSLGEQLKVLLAFAESVPIPLKSHISKQIVDAQQSLVEGNEPKKLYSLNNLLSVILTLQKSTHRVKEIIAINKQQTEVEVLYVGTAIGYFLAPDKVSAGRILFKDGKWQVAVENKLADRIGQAFKQLDRQGNPQLVDLPIGGEK